MEDLNRAREDIIQCICGREGLVIEQGELIYHNKNKGNVCGWVGVQTQRGW